MISDFKHVIFFHVDKVHLLSHGEILGKVKHDLETLKAIIKSGEFKTHLMSLKK